MKKFYSTPRKFVWDAHLISQLLILSFGGVSDNSSILLDLWNDEYFVSQAFGETVFGINSH